MREIWEIGQVQEGGGGRLRIKMHTYLEWQVNHGEEETNDAIDAKWSDDSDSEIRSGCEVWTDDSSSSVMSHRSGQGYEASDSGVRQKTRRFSMEDQSHGNSIIVLTG